MRKMNEKIRYHCDKCKCNHLLNSEIGRRHRGIKVEKPKRRTYEILFPDGTKYKTTSIYDCRYAVIKFAGSCSRYDEINGKNVSWHTDYRWSANLYESKKRAEDSYEWLKRWLNKPEYMGRSQIEKLKIIELDQERFKRY
jgi:hypothetical protein